MPNTLFAVLIRKDGEMIGMGRVVGDGGLFFQVVDIAVEPKHQGRGLGKAIVATIVEHLTGCGKLDDFRVVERVFCL